MRSALEWAQARAMAADGVSQREIARRLGVNRRTVCGGIDAIAVTPRDKIVAAGPYKPNDGRKWVLTRFDRSGGTSPPPTSS